MYIRATGNISPQKTFGHGPLLAELVDHAGNRLACIEPDYKNIIDIKLIRRMSRIIRMGVAAAMDCLQDAGLLMPDAIVTGTAYGCLEDTGQFLSKMIGYKEELLTPTAFIQSTHNTIGAQIGLMLQCNHYNNVFVHRGFSFENALLDAMLLVQEGDASNVLVGAIDEITNTSHAIISRFGVYRNNNQHSLQLLNATANGTIAGEGASFFVLSKEATPTDYAKLDGLSTLFEPANTEAVSKWIEHFLQQQQIGLQDIDLLVTGKNGDEKTDAVYQQLEQGIFSGITSTGYKHLCGEYPTATGFALWLAASILKQQTIPETLLQQDNNGRPVKRVLIYNHYLQLHHSLYLLSAC